MDDSLCLDVAQNSEVIATSNNTLYDEHVTYISNNLRDSDDENEVSFKRTRLKQFSESDSDGNNKENDIRKSNPSTIKQNTSNNSESDVSNDNFVNSKRKSRIRKLAKSGSESDSHSEKDNLPPMRYELTRIKNKTKKLQDKFKHFKNPAKSKKQDVDQVETYPETSGNKSSEESPNSDEEVSCFKIKQQIKKKSSVPRPSVCDPDTSDEESTLNIKEQKSKPRSIKPTSPKPMRMTAKQAMENMQKIKSESNRMLREKEVSLPYHRPKALNLKDIMNRRKPGLTSDGKSLPIKMNSEQLKQYALMLEERQKEMMELCKSESSEDEEDEINSETNLGQSEEQQVNICAENNVGNIDLIGDKSDCLQTTPGHEDDMVVEENLDKQLNLPSDKEAAINQKSTADIEMLPPMSPIESITRKIEEPEISNEYNENQETNIWNIEDNIEGESVTTNDTKKCTEQDSENISLHYDTEKTDIMETEDINVDNEVSYSDKKIDDIQVLSTGANKDKLSGDFSDDDFNMEEIDKIIENFEIPKETPNKPPLYSESTLDQKPKLTGAPGMVIDLDFNDTGSSSQKRLTGVELLKERYVYFAKLQCQEDMEKDREKKFKPGTQHLKLKQELEEQIAEQRCLEWTKRLEEENKLKAEMNSPEGEEFEDDIEKIEAKLEENDAKGEKEDSSSDEEDEDEDMDLCDVKEKPRQRNPMIDDEAEVSGDEDYDEGNDNAVKDVDSTEVIDKGDSSDSEDEEDNDDDSSESEQEEPTQPRKGRILKAFEDSDDEDSTKEVDPVNTNKMSEKASPDNLDICESQDDELPLAQLHKSYSEDLFPSQSSNAGDKVKDADTSFENGLGSQTFSIAKAIGAHTNTENETSFSEKLDVICETQPCDNNFDAIAGMCSGSFSQNCVTPQAESSQLSPSQQFGDDVVALCTGEFYNNPLVSQTDNENLNKSTEESDNANESFNIPDADICSNTNQVSNVEVNSGNKKKTHEIVGDKLASKETEGDNKLLKTILDELNDPEFDNPKPNKFFFNTNKNQSKGTTNTDESQLKKKFVIESDDEINEDISNGKKKKKKLRKRNLEKRALQISDDEAEEDLEHEEEEYESEIEEDGERVVEYDSEENEVEVQSKVVKKKRVGRDFFEQEAELTSEDEWMGSGDEDEAGLDRMEREEGDDDTFHQGQLQKELGQIHMREVLDQDKREVRLLQELLFEDGDLGDGHRQRKFRWKNAGEEEEIGTNINEYADTQEEEFESEEQWRKQRHEREMFLRKLQEKEEEDVNISFNRSTIIKASLCSKSSPNIKPGSDASNVEKPKTSLDAEKKTTKDIPSPKKPFIIFQQNYHNSLLTRGRGALARLAALATPLAADPDDGPKVIASSKRGNFVFAAITPNDEEPKTTKRKAVTNPGTPRLLKKMRVDETNKHSRNSILDHL